jgi:hypothetical protein
MLMARHKIRASGLSSAGALIFGTDSVDYFGIERDSSNNLAIRAYNTAWYTPFYINITSGNVGIGTTSPSGGLHVKTSQQWSAANYGASVVIDGTRNNALAILDSTSSNPWAIANSGGKLMFSIMPSLGDITNNPISPMVINSSGNVGIGTDSPDDKLTIAGGQIRFYDTDANSHNYAYFKTNATTPNNANAYSWNYLWI